jgi:hypothetical protein
MAGSREYIEQALADGRQSAILHLGGWAIDNFFSQQGLSTLGNFTYSLEIRSLSCTCMGRDSSVGIATSYGLDDRGVGVRVPVGSGILSSPRRPDRLWGPPNLLSNRYRG